MPAKLRFPRACFVVLGLLATSCDDQSKKNAGAAPPPPNVDVVTVQNQPVTLRTELPGRVNAHRIAQIRPQVSGVLDKRLFVEGAEVKAGQQLYQIDPRPYEAALASARAALAKARATALAARATADRYAGLVKAAAISKQDYDNAKAAQGQADADIATAEAQIQTAQINLIYTRMNAPISGRVGRSSVTEGALVTANQSDPLATVTELDPIYVDVTQPSATLLRLKQALAKGQLKRAGDDAAEVQLTLDDGTPYPVAGKLLFSEVTVDESTGSVTLRALYPNPDGILLPGMFVHETLIEGVRQEAILVPQRGVTHNQKGDAVALVVGPDNVVALKTLVTDRSVGTDWLVSSGLKPGDRVIVSGVQQAKPGQKVTPHDVPASGNAGGQTSPGQTSPSQTPGSQTPPAQTGQTKPQQN